MRAVSLALTGLFLSACTPLWEGRARSLQAEALERPAVVAARERSTAVPAPPPPADELAAADLAALIDLALQRNPRLAAKRSAVERRAHAVQAGGRLPEPRLQLAPYGEMAQTASGEVELMAGLSQAFPAPGMLSAEVARAGAELSAAEAALRAAEIAIAMDLRRAWWQYHLGHENLRILDDQLALFETLQEQILQALATGRATQSAALRIGVEIDRLRALRSAWRQRLTSAEADLRVVLALPDDLALPAAAASLPMVETYAYAPLAAAARRFRGDILANLAAEQQAEALSAMAAARRRPAFGLSLQYNLVDDRNLMGSTSGDDQWWVGASMSIPLWVDSYGAEARAAEAAGRQVAFERLAIEDDLRRDLANALSAWRSAHEQLELYRGGMLGQARQAAEAESANYINGRSGFADLMQAARQVLALEMGVARLERDAGLAEGMLLMSAGLVHADEVPMTQQESDDE